MKMKGARPASTLLLCGVDRDTLVVPEHMQTLTTLLKPKRVAGKLFKSPGVSFCKNKTESTMASISYLLKSPGVPFCKNKTESTMASH